MLFYKISLKQNIISKMSFIKICIYILVIHFYLTKIENMYIFNKLKQHAILKQKNWYNLCSFVMKDQF